MHRLIIHKIANNDQAFCGLVREVYKWGANSARLSGLYADPEKAKAFARTKVLDVFEKNLSKQHCLSLGTQEFETVGRAWLTDKSTLGQDPAELRVCYLKIDEQHQRQGLGKEAMLLLEEYATTHGFGLMTLNVFGHLPHAANLYSSLNFRTVDQMLVDGKIVATEMRKLILPQNENFLNLQNKPK
jgi:ribosomal protein S18 acetylase RimI-like enzyme